MSDAHFMRLALRLARRGYGTTAPNPMVGAVLVKGGRIIGRGWHRRAGLPHAEIEALNVSAKRFGWQRDPEGYEFNYVKEVDYCSGACILVRKDIFNRLNGFDEQFAPAYYEDTDLAFSVRNLGYKVVYQPDAEVIHFESKSHSNEASEEKQNLLNAHKLKFHKKWHRVLHTEHDKDRKDLFLSRDRSHHKKILLYIDRHVPTWDQDAGSLVAYDYLKVLSGLGTKVIFWPDDLRKIDPYTKKLQQMGMEIVYGDEDFKEYREKYGNSIHAAVLSRPAPSIKYIDDIRRHTTATIFYICHDLHFLRLQRKMTLEKDETLMKEIDQMKKAEIYLMRHSDLTIDEGHELGGGQGDPEGDQIPRVRETAATVGTAGSGEGTRSPPRRQRNHPISLRKPPARPRRGPVRLHGDERPGQGPQRHGNDQKAPHHRRVTPPSNPFAAQDL